MTPRRRQQGTDHAVSAISRVPEVLTDGDRPLFVRQPSTALANVIHEKKEELLAALGIKAGQTSAFAAIMREAVARLEDGLRANTIKPGNRGELTVAQSTKQWKEWLDSTPGTDTVEADSIKVQFSEREAETRSVGPIECGTEYFVYGGVWRSSGGKSGRRKGGAPVGLWVCFDFGEHRALPRPPEPSIPQPPPPPLDPGMAKKLKARGKALRLILALIPVLVTAGEEKLVNWLIKGCADFGFRLPQKVVRGGLRVMRVLLLIYLSYTVGGKVTAGIRAIIRLKPHVDPSRQGVVPERTLPAGVTLVSRSVSGARNPGTIEAYAPDPAHAHFVFRCSNFARRSMQSNLTYLWWILDQGKVTYHITYTPELTCSLLTPLEKPGWAVDVEVFEQFIQVLPLPTITRDGIEYADPSVRQEPRGPAEIIIASVESDLGVTSFEMTRPEPGDPDQAHPRVTQQSVSEDEETRVDFKDFSPTRVSFGLGQNNKTALREISFGVAIPAIDTFGATILLDFGDGSAAAKLQPSENFASAKLAADMALRFYYFKRRFPGPVKLELTVWAVSSTGRRVLGTTTFSLT